MGGFSGAGTAYPTRSAGGWESEASFGAGRSTAVVPSEASCYKAPIDTTIRNLEAATVSITGP